MTELAPASQWILQRYISLEEELAINLEKYTLGHSIDELYKFLWDSYADWYVEYLKTDDMQKEFAKQLFTQFVITLHPYMPFETEALWTEFADQDTLLAKELKDANWSKSFEINPQAVQEFQNIIDVITSLRSLRGLFAIDPATKLEVNSNSKELATYKEYLNLLGRTTIQEGEELSYKLEQGRIKFSIDILSYIPDVEVEKNRTNKNIQALEKQIFGLDKKLTNSKFLENATEEVIEESKANLYSRKQELMEQQQKLQLFNN